MCWLSVSEAPPTLPLKAQASLRELQTSSGAEQPPHTLSSIRTPSIHPSIHPPTHPDRLTLTSTSQKALEAPGEMRLQTALFLLLLASMVATLGAATQNLGSEIRSRFSVWLMSRMKRHSGKALAMSQEERPEPLVRREDVKDTLDVHSSPSDFNVRVRRSKGTSNQSWRQGCPIATCTVHILAHRLSELSNHQNANSAPLEKIRPGGYGRRRRSLAGGRHRGAPFLQT